MQIEQLPPNQPNFKLIVILFTVAIVVVLVVAYLFLRNDGMHLFRHVDHAYFNRVILRDGFSLPV
jgi:hypothetical protein